VVGAIIISVSYQVVMVYSPAWAPMTYFVIIILVLLFRPQGLFGKVGRGAI
jgi:branched-chain amino acid transport system permease protein